MDALTSASPEAGDGACGRPSPAAPSSAISMDPEPRPDRSARPMPVAAWLPVIVAGGMAGTTARAVLEAAFPAAPGAVPWTTLAINVAGSVLLGALLQGLALSGDDRGWRKAVRLGVGTGVIGGFTTYSTFALETVRLLGGGAAWTGAAYAAGSAAAGLTAAA
ncbi:CrcB family protein, partial [Schaalia naturae]|uniref:FluC/FEX family fluoride channel n=1 Tax=Schaalia naturae TaxID=635203 RepID=UPI00362A1868